MSKTIDIVNSSGASVGQYPVQESWLEYEKGTQAVHDCVVAFLSGERAGTASTKTRAEVSGGGAKPWRQKGSGRARAGSNRSPVWRKGGVIFGPKPRSFAKKVNKKVRQLALRRAFSDRIDLFKVIDQIPAECCKVKELRSILDTLGANNYTLLVIKEYDDAICRAAGNLPDVLTIKAASVNVYQLLRFNHIIITKDAMDVFVQRLG